MVLDGFVIIFVWRSLIGLWWVVDRFVADSGEFVVLVVVLDCGVVVAIMVVMVVSVVGFGGYFGCYWWFQFWLVVVAKFQWLG